MHTKSVSARGVSFLRPVLCDAAFAQPVRPPSGMPHLSRIELADAVARFPSWVTYASLNATDLDPAPDAGAS